MKPNATIARIGRWTGFVTALGLSCSVAILSASAAGQMKPQRNDQQSAEGNCQAKPDQNKSDNSDNSDDKTGSITKKLDKCGGVLQPPDVNDPGLVKPAPDTGEMPVIKPGQVPEQAPKQK
jgi:hypothetical protein